MEKADGKSRVCRAPQKLEEAPGKWVAKSMTMYVPAGDGEWDIDNRLTSTYDDRGYLAEEFYEDLYDNLVYVSKYTYGDSELDYVSVSQVGKTLSTLQNNMKVERATDSRMPSLITKSYRYEWSNGDWALQGTSYHRVVDRDASGNVTAVHYFSLYQGNFEEVQRVVMEYGADGKAVSMTEYQLSYDANMNEIWVEGYSYRDCVWYETDGQLCNLDYIFEDNNRVKSYTQYSSGRFICNVEVTYADDSSDFECMATYGDGSVSVQEWKNLANGGFQNDLQFMYVDDESGELTPDYGVCEREEFDVLNNLTLGYALEYYEDGVELYNWEEATCELNGDGLPTEYILRMFIPDEDGAYRSPMSRSFQQELSEPPCDGVWEDEVKMVFSDFEKLSGIGNVTADAAASDFRVEYFTLDGRRVDNPSSGIYIRRQGENVAKIAIR